MSFVYQLRNSLLVLGVVFVCTVFLLQQVHLLACPESKLCEQRSEKQAEASCCNSTVQELQALLLRWRRRAGELSCKSSSSGVGPTGGWCLEPSEGQLAVGHVPADQGICKGLIKYLPGTTSSKRVSLLDIGAGVGQYGRWLLARGDSNIEWIGYDGAENVETFTAGFVRWLDVTDPVFDSIPNRSDWVMSLEVGEHISPEATDTFLKLLDRHNCYGIILSWAVPGQDGFHHINCRPNAEIILRLKEMGYVQDDWALNFQTEVRRTAQHPWFTGTFMVFKRIQPCDTTLGVF